MKLLYTVIILGFIQLVEITPLEASISLRDELLELYDSELYALDKEYCEKAKVLSKNILQDKYVQQAATPVMSKFKQDIRDFLRDYPSYIRYGLIHELVILFVGIIPEPSSNPDKQYIWELLIIQGYEEFNYDYETKFEEFVQAKFLPKFEELKLKLSQDELQLQNAVIDWCNELKQCQDYECLDKYFEALAAPNLNPKVEIYVYIRKKIEIIDIFRGNSANDIANAVIKDQKLSQLSPAVRQHLIISLDNFIMKFESNQDMDELQDLIKDFENNILLKFYYNRKMPSKDRRLLMEIFNKNGYAKFLSNYSIKITDFVEQGFLVKFKEFKKALSRKELRSGKTLIKCFVKLKALTNVFDRYNKVQKCIMRLQKEFEIKAI